MSYARLVMLNLGSGMRTNALKILSEMEPLTEAKQGFEKIYAFGNDDTGEYGAFILWDTKEAAEATKDALLPVLKSKTSGIAKSPPDEKLFEVYSLNK